ncbi:hypothetical protein EDD18DRAFT_1129587 [Armillaria luteobubalina]|uniref:Uncharacterized protein n=1 Tax=Armillaria luteobubalina TaxID=153913 RepID=A0AA39U0Y6_9AGAR|nr:hypothetical protein EDD18DRAFT_1129587 [Armillaria luteobubalina]
MSFVGPSCPMVDARIIMRIGALHASRRLMVLGEWTVQTLQDLFTPYGDVYFASVYEALQKHNVAFHRDPETDIKFLDKDEADTFLFQFQPILAEQKNLTATAVETANLNPMTAFALSLGEKRALWLGLWNKKASDDNVSLIQTVLSQSGKMMSIRYHASVPVPYASLVVFFVERRKLALFAGSEVKFAKWNGVEDPPEVRRVVISGLTIPVPSQELFVEVPPKRQDYWYTPSSLSQERNAKPWQQSQEQ